MTSPIRTADVLAWTAAQLTEAIKTAATSRDDDPDTLALYEAADGVKPYYFGRHLYREVMPTLPEGENLPIEAALEACMDQLEKDIAAFNSPGTRSAHFVSASEVKQIQGDNWAAGAVVRKAYDVILSRNRFATGETNVLKKLGWLFEPQAHLKIPDVYEYDHPNEVSSSIKQARHTNGRDHNAIFAAEIAKTQAEYGEWAYGEEPGSPEWPVFQETGRDKNFLKTQLENFTDDSVLATLDELLDNPSFQPQVSWYRTFMTGAEIIGDDILVITQPGADESMVLRFSYVHA